MATTFEDRAAELLRLPPGEFTARRNALAKELRAQDRQLAERVAQLPKPALAAWALDVFAQSRPDELGELLDLGAELREAQQALSRDRMRDLTAQAHALVQQLMDDVRLVADEAGHALSDAAGTQVEQTLRAAMADADAADAVRAGLLAKPLQTGGFGAVDLTGAVAGAPQHVPAKRRPERTGDGAATERRERAERDAREAEESLRHAESELKQDEEALAAARADEQASQGQVTALRRDLDAAESQVRAATRAAREAKQAADRSAKHVEAARRRVETAHAVLEA